MVNSTLAKLLVAVLAVAAGMAQGGLFFADFGPGEAPVTRLIMSAALAVIAGSFFGYVFNRFWWLAVLTAWPLLFFVIFGIASISFAPGEAARFLTIFIPLILALVSGNIGARLKPSAKS